jgi:restriction endonuclease S subunit
MSEAVSPKTGWTTVAFGDVVKKVTDKVDPEKSGLERYVAGEHMDTDDLRIRRWGEICDDYLGPAFHMRFKPGQVLYGSRRTYLRKVALADFEGITANTTYVLESKDPEILLPELLPFIMQAETFHEHSKRESKGSVNPYVNFSDLAWYEFALPPLEEQRRISEAVQSIDTLIESQLALENKLMDLTDSILRILRLKAKSSEGGEHCLGKYINKVIGGGTPSKSTPEYWGGKIPWMTVKDIPETGFVKTTVETISEAGLESSAANLIPSNSVILATRIALGKVVRNKNAVAINQDLKAIFPTDEVLDEFLFYWLKSVKHLIFGLGAGTTVKGIRLEDLKKIPFSPPSKTTQRFFVASLKGVDQALSGSTLRRARLSFFRAGLLNRTLGDGDV